MTTTDMPKFTRKGACEACGFVTGTTSWHHIIPRAHGGRNNRSNLIELCQTCHNAAEEHGKGWITQQQILMRKKREAAVKAFPHSVKLGKGEHLSYDTHEMCWKIWGIDEWGIYATEVEGGRSITLEPATAHIEAEKAK